MVERLEINEPLAQPDQLSISHWFHPPYGGSAAHNWGSLVEIRYYLDIELDAYYTITNTSTFSGELRFRQDLAFIRHWFSTCSNVYAAGIPHQVSTPWLAPGESHNDSSAFRAILQGTRSGLGPNVIDLDATYLANSISGWVEWEWIPNPAPLTTVCSGSANPNYTLHLGGKPEEPLLYAPDAPQSQAGVYIKATEVSPMNQLGLCIGGSINRLGVALSGAPIEYVPPALGVTRYLQHGSRTATGRPVTSECVAYTH